MRITLQAHIGKARIPLQVDVGFGDAITPPAEIQKLTGMLNFPLPILPIYPRESVVAEKYETMVRLGIGNSRMKDYYDLWVVSREFEFDGEILLKAIQGTFHRRKTQLPATIPIGLSDEFASDAGKLAQWQAFVGRTALRWKETELMHLVEALRDFLLPPTKASRNKITFQMRWPKRGPWRAK